MKIKLTAFLLFTNLSLPGLFAQTGLYVPQLANYDTVMLGFMSNHNIPGGQLAITYRGRLVYNRGFGLADVAAGDSVYPHNIFRMASLSKPVTAVAIMKLFEQGQIGLDDQVFGAGGILNDTAYPVLLDPLDTLITIRMLLQHSGGWDATLSGDPMFDAYTIATAMGVPSPPAPEVIIHYVLANKMLDFLPGTQAKYSNFGFCVLGKVIEKITGQSYATYVRDTILNPLGIYTMQLGFNMPASQLPNEVHYYDYPLAPYLYSVYDNTTLVPAPYGGFNIEAMDALGRWVASAEDIVKLVCAFDRFNSRPDLLTVATIDTMTRPSATHSSYACGLGVDNLNHTWGHYGSLYGNSGQLLRIWNPQVNFAVLFNSNDTDGTVYADMTNLIWNALPTISSWPVFDLFTGIDETQSNLDFQVYPNPSSSEIFISCPGKIKEIIIVDAYGKDMLSLPYPTPFRKINIPILHFKNGIYFVKAIGEGKSYCRKLMVIHP